MLTLHTVHERGGRVSLCVRPCPLLCPCWPGRRTRVIAEGCGLPSQARACSRLQIWHSVGHQIHESNGESHRQHPPSGPLAKVRIPSLLSSKEKITLAHLTRTPDHRRCSASPTPTRRRSRKTSPLAMAFVKTSAGLVFPHTFSNFIFFSRIMS